MMKPRYKYLYQLTILLYLKRMNNNLQKQKIVDHLVSR